jgi:urea transporter
VADAIFILGMAVPAFLQRPDVAALIIVITVLVTIVVILTALVLDRRAQREADSVHRTNTL